MKLNTYQKTALATILATIFLIFVGGLVRAAGAGLGCPDWPKCFGSWIPPTNVVDLPSGFDTSQFNVYKTWTEYINRLIGVVIGLLITATFLLSFRYREKKPVVFYSSAAAFAMVLFQGWLGGQVVKSGLNEGLITIHMLLAMAIMMSLIFAAFRATQEQFVINIDPRIRKWLNLLAYILLGLTIIELTFGTQVREAVDAVKNAPSPPPREVWLEQVGWIDELHRTFAWSILIAGGAIFYLSRWKTSSDLISVTGLWIFGVILFQIGLGIGLYYLGMPPAYQVMHLVGVAVLIATEFIFLLLLRLPNSATDS